jgi:hypothetical protein
MYAKTILWMKDSVVAKRTVGCCRWEATRGFLPVQSWNRTPNAATKPLRVSYIATCSMLATFALDHVVAGQWLVAILQGTRAHIAAFGK